MLQAAPPSSSSLTARLTWFGHGAVCGSSSKAVQVSALATQVTYEGMLDRVFGIDSGFVRVGEDIGRCVWWCLCWG